MVETGDRIAFLRFDTREMAPEDRIGAWQAMLPWFETGIRQRSETFVATAEAWLLDMLVVSLNHLPAAWLSRSPRRIAADGRSDYAVIVGDAVWQAQIGDSKALVEPGTVCVLDNAHPFTVETTGGTFVILNVPRDMLRKPASAAPLHGHCFTDAFATLFLDFLRSLITQLPELPIAQAAALARAVRELLAACITAGGIALFPSIGMSRAQRVAAYIDMHLEQAMTADTIARAIGVSRAQLYRIFAPVGGVSRHIVRRRLDSARTLLIDQPELTVAQIAYASGFLSAAHFSRAFKQAFGMTPSAARASGHGPATGDNLAARYHLWFPRMLSGDVASTTRHNRATTPSAD